jgi:8-oxo-dGTP diphosphatase
VTLYLVRHAKAGSRHDWDGEDRLRPLSKSGRRQAVALAERMAGLDITALVSSPYRRCVETLEPLAAAVGVDVATDECLGESRGFEKVMELLASLVDDSVVCSHGDVIPETIAALERRGCRLMSAPEWGKASVWLLDRNADGEIVQAEAWPPPDVG